MDPPDFAPAAKYASEDWRLIDYRYVQVPGAGNWVRGPLPSEPDLAAGRYVSFLGSAHTFGRLVDVPFPTTLAARLGLPALNLGYGGARPGYYATNPRLLELVNGGRLAVVQIMSARGAENSVLRPEGPASALMYRTEEPEADPMFADMAWRRLWMDRTPPDLLRLMGESRAAWQAEMRATLAAIRVPYVLLWFSRRSPELVPDFTNHRTMLGGFPHLVDREALDAVVPSGVRLIECVTEAEPVDYHDRFDGTSVELEGNTGTYYPSRREHDQVAAALEPVLARLLD